MSTPQIPDDPNASAANENDQKPLLPLPLSRRRFGKILGTGIAGTGFVVTGGFANKARAATGLGLTQTPSFLPSAKVFTVKQPTPPKPSASVRKSRSIRVTRPSRSKRFSVGVSGHNSHWSASIKYSIPFE
jgi:hypothetical protein